MADRADLNNDLLSSEILIFIPDEHSIREWRRLSYELSAKGWAQMYVATRTDGYSEGELCLLTAEELLAATEAQSAQLCLRYSPCGKNKNVLTITKVF